MDWTGCQHRVMTRSLCADPIPLTKDPDGTFRVGNCRVTLDCLASVFQEGATPEMIVERFPSLQLADVYMAFGYLLCHPEFFEEEGQANPKAPPDLPPSVPP